jgi:hypothetical protein
MKAGQWLILLDVVRLLDGIGRAPSRVEKAPARCAPGGPYTC